MKDLFFWRTWSATHRSTYLVLLTFFLIIVLYYTFAVLNGENNALEWNITSNAETIEVGIKKFQVGLFEFEFSADNYLINQFYQGSRLLITPVAAHIFLVIFCLCFAILLTIGTFLKRFWYLVAMTVGAAIFVNMRLEQLEVLGWIDNTTLLVVLGLLLPLSYYLHAFRTEWSFLKRLTYMIGCFAVFSIFILYFSQKSNPAYFLAHYNYTAPVVLTILFIFLVSHEIIFLILFLVSGSKTDEGRGNLFHLIALAVIYLLNVGLVYLRNAFIIDWDIIYVNAFLLLIMSALIGIPGLRQRENRYEHIMSFNPLGGYFFLTLGIICFSTITFHTITVNDPVLETFEDAIVYSHIGFGIMFLLYILSNFVNLIGKGLAVYKVAYKEDNMPYFSANVAGLVIVAAFYYLSNQAALQQAIAGYYNGLGSVYEFEGDDFLAEEYYKLGSIFGFNNHRSNYGIAEIAYRQDDRDKAIDRLKKATSKNPTEYAYINLANAQKTEFLYFDALFTLREALKRFPKSPHIKNNLALMYKNTNLLDSAVYYMESGADEGWGTRTNTTNIIEILARNKVTLPTDSLIEIYNETTHSPLKSNLLAYSNNTGYWLNAGEIPIEFDSSLDLHEFAQLYNHTFSQLKNSTPEEIEAIEETAGVQTNGLFYRELNFLIALQHYFTGNINKAFRAMDVLRNDPLKKGYYNHILGIMAMEQKSPQLAIDFFGQALTENYESARVNLAIALAEAGEKSQALGLWNQILVEDSIEVANDILVALTAPVSVITSSNSDALKYQAIRFRTGEFDEGTVDSILASMSDSTFMTGAFIAAIDNAIKKHDYEGAASRMERLLAGGTVGNVEIESISKRLEIMSLIGGDISTSEVQQAADIVTSWNTKDTQFFLRTGMNNPFNEEEVLLASRYFREINEDEDQAYNILLNAIEINPHSISLQKAYTLQSIRMGLTSYADTHLSLLKEKLSREDYIAFEVLVEEETRKFDSFSFPSTE